ncbi:MAG: sulfite exporter TauE/SafE family protein [Pseudomonadota bacterium]
MSSSLSDPILLVIAAVFLLAGFVKGTIGLGLPTVAMGLLATRMPPAHALAIVIIPAIVTNIWQTFVGPYLRDIVRRLWPLMIGTVAGIMAGAGLMTGPYARYGTVVLGVLLVIYAIIGLSKVRFSVAPSNEKWVGGIVGVVTGVVSAATGVQVIPSMPFMQAIGMEKDELVQALGVFFTTATVALAFNLADAGLLNASIALPGGIAMIAAFAGMYLGQLLRSRMEPETFRRWFLIAMLLLGIYLAGDMLTKIYA